MTAHKKHGRKEHDCQRQSPRRDCSCRFRAVRERTFYESRNGSSVIKITTARFCLPQASTCIAPFQNEEKYPFLWPSLKWHTPHKKVMLAGFGHVPPDLPMPRRSHQTASLLKLKRALGEAKGTPLSLRMLAGRPRS